MRTTQELHHEIDNFARAYDYDASYMTAMVDASQAAFEAFLPVQAMAGFREALPLHAHFIARIVTMQAEDCGACAQLNLRMAVEAGVEHSLLATLLADPAQLPPALGDVRVHALGVANREDPDPARLERLHAEYGAAAMAELATCIAGARIYPTLKRSLGRAQACERLTLDF